MLILKHITNQYFMDGRPMFTPATIDEIRYLKIWQTDKFIGDPKPTELQSVDDLKKKGVVGIYMQVEVE